MNEVKSYMKIIFEHMYDVFDCIVYVLYFSILFCYCC